MKFARRTKALQVVAVVAEIALVALIAYRIVTVDVLPRIVRDLHADIAWSYVSGPLPKRTRSYRWYPLTYPVLERWSLDSDEVRATYAITTIEHFGGFLGRHWLSEAIDRNPVDTSIDFPAMGGAGSAELNRSTGLDDGPRRQAAAAQAVRHLGTEDPNLSHFDDRLLQWLGPDALPALEDWARTATPAHLVLLDGVLPDDPDASSEYAPRYARLRAIADRAGKIVASHQPVAPQPFESAERAAVYNAVIALNNGDTHGLPLLKIIVDGDLRRLGADVPSPDLIVVANAFPNSRFTHGCLAYDALRGGTYFGRDDASDDRVPTAPADAWRRWLAKYPDHPGADDAAYWLGRTLQRDGLRADATRAYLDALQRRYGDGDMFDAIWRRLRYMLDVGASERDLALVEQRHPTSRFNALVRYARAVRRARANDFPGALSLASPRLLDAFPRADGPSFDNGSADLHAAYASQRSRWQTLAALVPNIETASAETRDRLASTWNEDDGWKIGYLELFGGDREGGAMHDASYRILPAASNVDVQMANQNAQTIALAAPLSRAPNAPDIRRRNQRRVVVALYRQQAEFPDSETDAMGSLAALPSSAGYDESLYHLSMPQYVHPGEPYYDDMKRASAVEAWWIRQTIVEAEKYVRDYPDDDFASTALIATFEVSGRTRYLREVIARYPQGPRTEEARALLWRAKKF